MPETIITPPEEVRAQFHRIKPPADIAVSQRGWTLDVLNIVRRICEMKDGSRGLSPHRSGEGQGSRGLSPHPVNQFTNDDVYLYARELESLHPGNRHVRDKIRQQLQVLRDTGFLVHESRSVWRMAAGGG